MVFVSDMVVLEEEVVMDKVEVGKLQEGQLEPRNPPIAIMELAEEISQSKYM